MLELLIRLEYKRRALRRRLLGTLGISGDSYFVMAVVVFFVGTFFVAPVTAAVAPVAWPTGFLMLTTIAVIGLVLLGTIILAPAGLFFL